MIGYLLRRLLAIPAPFVMLTAIFFAVCLIVVNTLTDLAYGLVDPRV